MNRIARATVSLTASCVACVCLAQEAPQTQADTARIDFATVDKDENGRLSKEEARSIAELEGAFQHLDADQDQVISRTEFARWSRAGKTEGSVADPATAPRGSAGSQHMPAPD